ncbi:hypothetical protein [Microbacterium capsulatum]|uniref:Uncharacterized protein n=1 Tax=Microbacterium capsulatum TaxID=3041921 RepID=A0ABU0XFA6_9MICO|nr:hypothetical protein [Microbacterium sp. ASV81]MDQ4213303.1 hypothetical protein [Microbacterium sp. ASV81]
MGSALAVVAFVTAAAVAIPSGAHATIGTDPGDYAQTLPASVLNGSGLSPEQITKEVSNTRSGVLAPGSYNVAPTRIATGAANGLFGGLSLLVQYGAGQGTEQVVDYSHDSPKPSYISQSDWDNCARVGGPFDEFFTGVHDWLSSLAPIGGSGVDCNAIRASWKQAKNPSYQPQNVTIPAGIAQFPLTFAGITFGVPQWSDTTVPASGTTPPLNVARKEGWVIPVSGTLATGTGSILLEMRLVSTSGPYGTTTDGNYISVSVPLDVDRASVKVDYKSARPGCVNCVILDKLASSDSVAGFTMPSGTKYQWRARLDWNAYVYHVRPNSSGSWTTLNPMPYNSPDLGAPTYSPGVKPVQLMTTVFAESGHTFSCRTSTFLETDALVPQPCAPTLPPSEIETKRIVEVVPADEPGYIPGSNPTRTQVTSEVPQVIRDWQRTYQPGNGTLLKLDLIKQGVGSCLVNPLSCAGWYSDPNKSTLYQCTYGGQVLDLSECYYYSRLFEPNAIATGTAYPQPGASNPASAPTATTSPQMTLEPGTQPGNPEANRNCWAGAISWNPVDWVFVPIKCALEWAFVPRASQVENVKGNISRAWEASSMGQLLASVGSMGAIFSTSSGCSGLPFGFDAFGVSFHGRLFEACSEPWAGVAAVVRGILTGVIALGGFLAVIRYGAGVFGFVGLGLGLGDHDQSPAGVRFK